MKILVCISHVPDTTSKINFTDGDTKFDTQGVQFVINPNDEFGLTRAMWLKEKQGASIDVINVGNSSSEPTLRKALAIGADKAIRIDCNANDAYSVAKEIELEDKFENMGAQMVKQVSSQTSDEAGDGTTTATVLAQSIVNEGHKSVAAGMNPMDLKRGIDKAIATNMTDINGNVSRPSVLITLPKFSGLPKVPFGLISTL